MQLQHYVHSLFKTNRTAVVGVGIEHECLLAFAKNLEIESGEGPQQQSIYYGGEQRQNTSSALAHVAVAVEGTRFKLISFLDFPIVIHSIILLIYRIILYLFQVLLCRH